jgi:hypothetical protein
MLFVGAFVLYEQIFNKRHFVSKCFHIICFSITLYFATNLQIIHVFHPSFLFLNDGKQCLIFLGIKMCLWYLKCCIECCLIFFLCSRVDIQNGQCIKIINFCFSYTFMTLILHYWIIDCYFQTNIAMSPR